MNVRAPLSTLVLCVGALFPALATSTMLARFAPLSEADGLLAATLAFPIAYLVWMCALFARRGTWRPVIAMILFTATATITVVMS